MNYEFDDNEPEREDKVFFYINSLSIDKVIDSFDEIDKIIGPKEFRNFLSFVVILYSSN